MNRIEQLAGFKEHFDDMLVYVPASGFSWMGMKDEDVHGWWSVVDGWWIREDGRLINFQGLGAGSWGHLKTKIEGVGREKQRLKGYRMDPRQAFELKHVHGIPHYVQNGIAYTFELSASEPGKPSAECVAIGTYDAATDRVVYAEDWRERVQSHLDAFRAGLEAIDRNAIRKTLVKPQKSRKPPRTSRKGTSRTKVPTDQ